MRTSGWEMPATPMTYPCNRNGLMKADEEARWELDRILDGENIKAVFQPIVSLADAGIVGYEALSRGPQGSLLERPDKLFAAAEKADKLWDLELLCRSKALGRAGEMDSGKMMFINVAPNIIHDRRFQKGFTREILAKYKIDATNIIFEITEKTSIDDYRSFRKVLDNYTSQGYKIALDDTGSGYSGLKLLAETRPQFVKIDMDLVRDIDKDSLKHALMKAFYEFSLATHIKIIAEGIETVDELNTLIDIGIPYGQGYFMQKPAPEFLELPPAVKEHIVERNRLKRKETVHNPLTLAIGELARRDVPFAPDQLGCHVIDHFNANRNVMGIAVVEDDRPVGLLMKEKLWGSLATQYGVAVYMNRPIKLLMDASPLIVDYNTPLEQVSKAAISRPESSLYDYIIVVREGRYYGITTVRSLLDKTTTEYRMMLTQS